MTTLSRLQALLAENITFRPAAEIFPDTRFAEDLSMDSIDWAELFNHIEDEFGIQIKEEQADTFNTVADAVALIDRCLAEKNPAP